MAASGFPAIEAKSVPNQGASEDDPRFDPVVRRYESVSGVWGWVAAVAALLLIGFVTLASWNNNIASSDSSSRTTASRTTTPPSHRGLRLVIAEADHPGAIEERYAVRSFGTDAQSGCACG